MCQADYLQKAFPHVPAVFSDMKQLWRGSAWDFKSGAKARIPEATCRISSCFSLSTPCSLGSFAFVCLFVWYLEAVGLIAGYPCRSLSAQNPDQRSFLDKTSSTGAGYDSVMKYLQKNPCVQFALLENVQGMFHVRKQFASERPMEIQTRRMKKLGFHCVFSCLLNSSEFGLPQSRSRAYALYMRDGTYRPPDANACKRLFPVA